MGQYLSIPEPIVYRLKYKQSMFNYSVAKQILRYKRPIFIYPGNNCPNTGIYYKLTASISDEQTTPKPLPTNKILIDSDIIGK